MIWITLVIIASTLIGVFAERRWPERAGVGSRRAMLILLYVILPPVIFENLAHADFVAGTGIGLAIGLVSVCLVLFAAWAIAVPILKLPRPVAGAVICCSIVPNTTYLGYPMVLTLMGGHQLSQGVVYDVVVSGTSLFVFAFAVGAAFGTKAGENTADRVRAFFFKNPLLAAAVLGLLAPKWMAPDLLVDISRVLVTVILPVGFFAVGAVLAEEERSGAITLPPRIHRQIGGVIFARLIISPAVLLVLSMPFSGIPESYYLMAAMPTGLNSMIVGHAYGLDLRTTAEALVYTTAIVLLGALVWVVVG